MLGLVLLYWIGKYFYKLAEEFTKSKWGYAIFGIVIYYGSQLVIGFMLALLNDILSLGLNFDSLTLNLIGIPIGLICCYFSYNFLAKKWKREFVNPAAEIDSIGSTEE